MARRKDASAPPRRTVAKIEFEPRTPAQVELVKATQEYPIVIVTGPAGTGKTLVLVASALTMLLAKEIEKIIITRPVVEAAQESLGFLPGTLEEKMDPYLVPIKDSIAKFVGKDTCDALFEYGRIEVVPLAYMRGRSLEDAVVICDESQNCTFEGLKMLLTRFGRGCKVFLNGDTSQIDLGHGRSGLDKIMSALYDVEEAAMVRFTNADNQRHPVVAKVITALEKFERIKDGPADLLGRLPKS